MWKKHLEMKILDKEEVQLYCNCDGVSADELGEALLGFSELFSEANRRAGNPPLVIKINNLKIGSIEITSVLELCEEAKDMVLGRDAQAIISIFALITICRQVFADIENIKKGITSGCSYALRALKKMLVVLKEENSELKLKSSEKEVCIKSSEAQKIRELKEDEILVNESVIEQYFSIFSLTFRRGDKGFNKWKLADGDNIFSVTIKDSDFLNLINNQNLALHRDDLMLCKMRCIQYKSSTGTVRTERIVEKVVKYEHSPMQEGFNFEGKKAAN